jgi:acyl carrier protein
MTERAVPDRDTVGTLVRKHLAARIEQQGLSPQAIGEDFDLIDGGLLDSFAFVELVVGVSEDLQLEMDLADLGNDPFSTLGELVDAFRDAASHV